MWINNERYGRLGELIHDFGFGESSIHEDTGRSYSPYSKERHDRRQVIVCPQGNAVPPSHSDIKQPTGHASRPIVDFGERMRCSIDDKKRAFRVDSSCVR